MTGSATRRALLNAASLLLERRGPDGVTTRAVCLAADVKAPTLYHHFGDKEGLLDALVSEGISEFLEAKQATSRVENPVDGLTAGWDAFIAFALDRPRLFALMAQRIERNPDMLQAVMATTEARLDQLSAEGLLAVDVDFAKRTMLALSVGVTALATHGEARPNVEAIGRFLLGAALKALLR